MRRGADSPLTHKEFNWKEGGAGAGAGAVAGGDTDANRHSGKDSIKSNINMFNQVIKEQAEAKKKEALK